MIPTIFTAYLFNQWFLTNIATLLILQLGVVTVALNTDKIPSILSGLIGALAYNYLFTKPYFSLHMVDYDELISMLVFLIIAFITSHLAYYYKQQGEQLKQAQLRASILLSVSHDLRTPLSSIIGTLSTLKEYQHKLAPQERDDLLTNALDESHRLHRYIENLLQATKIQHGVVNLQFALTDMSSLVRSVINRFNTNRISISEESTLQKVEVQAQLLEQAVFNLIDNALKYSPASLPVQISLEQHEESLDILVADQGPGICDLERQKVFDLFYSTRKGDSGEGGTGLGLHVAAGIIQAHRGTLDIVSAARGCCMRIRLPLSQK
jgi:K+-sensing histidine kinase KdpD